MPPLLLVPVPPCFLYVTSLFFLFACFVFVDSCMPPKEKLEHLKKMWKEDRLFEPRTKIGADGTVITYWCELREKRKALAGGT